MSTQGKYEEGKSSKRMPVQSQTSGSDNLPAGGEGAFYRNCVLSGGEVRKWRKTENGRGFFASVHELSLGALSSSATLLCK